MQRLKPLQCIILLFLFIFSQKLQAQRITPKDLIGTWTYVRDWESFALSFKNDSLVTKDTQLNTDQEFSYTLDSTQKGYVLSMRGTNKSAGKQIHIYQLLYFPDYLVVHPYKDSVFNKKTKQWVDQPISPSATSKYILVKQQSN